MTFLLDHLPRRSAPVHRHPRRPAAAAGAAAQPRAAGRDARRRPALHAGRGDTRSSTRSWACTSTPDDVDALERRTEGWIAGLQLAALSLRAIATRPTSTTSSRRSPAATASSSTTSPRRSCARQPDRRARLPARTAVLDRLTGPLCDAVTGRRTGSAMLEELERGNLFVVPLDDRALLVPLPPPVRRRAAGPAARRASRPGPAAAPARPATGTPSSGLPADARPARPRRSRTSRAPADLVEEALPEARRRGRTDLLLTGSRACPERGGPTQSGAEHRGRRGARLVRRRPRRRWRPASPTPTRRSRRAAAAMAATWRPPTSSATAPATISIYRASLAQARGDVAGTVRHARRVL